MKTGILEQLMEFFSFIFILNQTTSLIVLILLEFNQFISFQSKELLS